MANREAADRAAPFGPVSDHQANRRHERHETFDLAEVTSLHCEVVGSVVDISSSGLKLQIAQGPMPIEGEPVTVRLAGGGHLSGQVVWLDGKNVGVEFDRERPDPLELLWPEVHGPNWFGRLVHLQLKRQSQ